MFDKLSTDAVTIAVAIVGLATIAVIVSNKAQAGTVITDLTSGFANDIKAAVSPVS